MDHLGFSTRVWKSNFLKKKAKSNYFLKDEESQQNSSILSLSSYNPSALPLI